MSGNPKIIGRLLTLALLSSAICFADVVTGTFTISGTADVSLTSISFTNTTITNNMTSDPVTAPVGTSVSIKPLDEANSPVNGSFDYTGWLTAGDLSLDLTSLPAGGFTSTDCALPPAVGQTCTPVIPGLVTPDNPLGKSNLNLSNVPGAAPGTISFGALFSSGGIAHNTAEVPPGTDKFSAVFSAVDVPDVPYQTLLATVAHGGTVPVFFTASFTLVPEPGYLPVLGGLAVLGLFAALYRKRRIV
jgi:hypothetical protein